MNAQTVAIEVEPTTAAILRTKAAAQGLTIDAFLQALAETAKGSEPLATPSAKPARKSLLGAFAHEGFSVTPEDIQEVRREMWQNFPRELPE